MSEWFSVDFVGVEKLQEALLQYRGRTAEKSINEVLHGEGAELAKDSIYRLMPRSDKKTGRHARDSKSLTQDDGNLSVTVVARGKWHYLYFPDDGTTTRRHVGNQQFFRRGAETVTDDIVDRCVNRLITNFENEV